MNRRSKLTSPVGLASRPVRILLCDEIDRWPESARKEGDPLSIVEKRTKTYPYTHKMVFTSTPTIDSISRIQHEYKLGSMEEWQLPCPACGTYNSLTWNGNIRFEHMYDSDTKKLDESQEVLAVCHYCDELSNEMAWKSGRGRWLAENPESEIKSFHMNALASPWTSWIEILKSFLSSKDDIEMLKVWVNTEMGEPWFEEGDAVDYAELYNRREDYVLNAIGANGTGSIGINSNAIAPFDIPKDVLVLTCGVDVQDDRFELEIVGWGIGKASWGIEYVVIHGNTSLPDTWDKLDWHLQKRYICEDGSTMPITTTFIDSGGHRTTEVYKFCKTREYRGVWAIKGRGGSGMNIIHNFSKTKKVRNLLVIVAVDTAKSVLFTRLGQNEPDKAGYCHFPMNKMDNIENGQNSRGYDEKYFEGLTSEVRVTRMVNGRPKTEWKLKSGTRNEPLDVRVYNIAALEFLNPNFDALKRRRLSGSGRTGNTASKRKYGTVSRGVEI